MNKKDLHAKTESILRIIVAAYAAVLVLANFLRIFDNVFWGDEAYSIRLGWMSFGHMISETASDVHPPLYYFFLSALVRIFGRHGWVYHLSAFIPFAIVMIFAVCIFARRFGNFSAFLFATLMGISDNAVTYNMEVRMYSLAFMFVLFSFYSLYLLIKKEKRSEVWFVLFSLGAAYTHYYALLAVSFFYMALFFRCFVKKDEIKRFVLISAFTVAGYLPWLFKLFATFGRTTGDYWMDEIPGIKDLIKYYFFSGESKWYSYGMFAAALICFFMCLKKGRSDENEWMLWGLASCFGTVIAGEIVSYFLRPVFAFRFMYPVVSVMAVILCVSAGTLKYGRILCACLAAISCIVYVPGFAHAYSYERYVDAECRETLDLLEGTGIADALVITNGEHLDWTLIDYYIPGAEHEYAESLFSANIGHQEGRSCFLLWMDELTPEESEMLESEGFEITVIKEGGYIGNWVNIYQLD